MEQEEIVISLDRMEVDREETEITIQQLENTESQLRKLMEEKPIGLAREKLAFYLKDIEKELEWNEQILQEQEESISFVQERGY